MYTNMFSNFFKFPIGHLTHPPPSKVFLDFCKKKLFTWPLTLFFRIQHFIKKAVCLLSDVIPGGSKIFHLKCIICGKLSSST